MVARPDTHGPFTLSIIGEGEPRTMMLGGISYSPGDHEALALALPGEKIIVSNPLQCGGAERGEASAEWLQEQYRDMFTRLGCQYLLGHSAGSFHAILMHNRLLGLKGLVALAPPTTYKAPEDIGGRLEEFGFLDRTLAPLCRQMRDETYRALLLRHQQTYGKDHASVKANYKLELREAKSLGPSVVAMLQRLQVHALLVTGRADPWYDPAGVPTHPLLTHLEMDTGHFPHVERPDELATAIEAWRKPLG